MDARVFDTLGDETIVDVVASGARCVREGRSMTSLIGWRNKKEGVGR